MGRICVQRQSLAPSHVLYPPLSGKRAMSPPQNLLKPFLQSARYLLATAVKTPQPISIVLGNESAGNNPPSPVFLHQPYIAQTSTQSPPQSSTLIFPHFILVPSLSSPFRAQIFSFGPNSFTFSQCSSSPPPISSALMTTPPSLTSILNKSQSTWWTTTNSHSFSPANVCGE